MCGKVSLADKIETTGEITKPACAGTCQKLCPAMLLFKANAKERHQNLINDVFDTQPVIQSGNPDSFAAFFKVGGWH